MISFFIPMDKIPTATLQQKKAAYVKGHLMMYEPQNVKDAKRTFELALKPHRLKNPINGPLALYIRWNFPIKDKKKQNTWKESRPDLDNMEKIIIDRMTALGFWNDDSQIVSLCGEKVYVSPKDGGIQIDIVEATEFYRI